MTAMSENIELMMPIKATPYDHQKRAFAFVCDKFGVFDERLKSRGTALLMEMGTGKTIVCTGSWTRVPMLLVDDVDNKEFLRELLESMYEELPAPKKKK